MADDRVIEEAVETASELMNKHHAALDTIREANIRLAQGDVNGAQATLNQFILEFDLEEEEAG